jgi:hypothetical protein
VASVKSALGSCDDVVEDVGDEKTSHLLRSTLPSEETTEKRTPSCDPSCDLGGDTTQGHSGHGNVTGWSRGSWRSSWGSAQLEDAGAADTMVSSILVLRHMFAHFY